MINLDKGQKISLDKEYGSELKRIRLGAGWYPANYVPVRFRKTDGTKSSTTTIDKPKSGFMSKVGDLFKGEARIGDVVNSAIDSGKSVVNKAVDLIDGEFNSSSLDSYTEKLEAIDVDLTAAFYSKGQLKGHVFWHDDHQSLFNGAVRHSGDNRTGKPRCPEDMEKDKEYITVDLAKLPDYIDEFVHFVQIYEGHEKGQDFGTVGGGFARLSNEDTLAELAFFNLTENYDGIEGLYLTRFYKYNGSWRMETLGEGVKFANYVNDMLKQYKSINV